MTSLSHETYILSPLNRRALYRESGLYQVEIQGFNDSESSLSLQERRVLSKGPFESLDALVQAAYQDRVNRLGPPAISSQSPDRQRYFISHSATNQYDLVCRPKPEKGFLDLLGISSCPEDLLSTQHITLKNGFNGNRHKIYLDEEKNEFVEVHLDHAISGSWDRESEGLQMARRVAPLKNGEASPETPSDCYTGRVESESKALEQARMLFFGELHAKEMGKGLVREEVDDDGIPTYTLHYVVNSLQSTSPIYAAASPLNVEQEQKYVFQEAASLKKISQSSHLLICPKTKQKYRVKFRPILFSRQVNIFANFERILPSNLSGEAQSLAITREGWQALRSLASKKIASLPPEDADLAKYIIQQLDQSIMQSFLKPQMSATNELVLRDMLCKLLNLPIVYHCKSSTDRTSAAIAMSSSLRQWKELGLEYPKKFEELIEDERFHELFLANWFAGHQISRNARSPNGFIEMHGKEKILDHERLGISANDEFAQCELFPKLMPKRYRKNYRTEALTKPKNIALVTLWILFSPLINLFASLANPYGNMQTPSNLALYFILAPFAFFLTYFSSLLKAFSSPRTLFPKEIVEIHQTEKPERRLFTGTKHQKAHTHSLETLPSHALSLEEYKKNFENHFNHPLRPAREIIHANVMESSGVKHLKCSRGEWAKEKVLAKLAAGLDENVIYSINGTNYIGIEERNRLLHRLQKLNGNCYESEDSLLHQAWVQVQKGELPKEDYIKLQTERDKIHEILTNSSPEIFHCNENYAIAQAMFQNLLKHNRGDEQKTLRELSAFRKSLLGYARMRTKARSIPKASSLKVSLDWQKMPKININTYESRIEAEESASITSEGSSFKKLLKITTKIDLNSGQGELSWNSIPSV